MRLASITLRNFKAIGDQPQKVELAPVTLLFGPNSAGKSTVLQALVFLREVIVRRNLDPDRTELGGDSLDLGGFLNLVHGRKLGVPMEVGVRIELGSTSLPDYLTRSDESLLENGVVNMAHPDDWLAEVSLVDLSFRLLAGEDGPWLESLHVAINGERFARISSDARGRRIVIDELDLDHPILADGPEARDDYGSYRELFEAVFDFSAVAQPQRAVTDILEKERPFMNLKVGELEELAGSSGESREVIDKILQELTHRKTRAAKRLEERLYSISEGGQEDLAREVPSFLPLEGQDSVLPARGMPFRIARDVLAEGRSNYNAGDRSSFLLLRSVLAGLIVGPVDLLADLLDEFSYIGPLRDLPPRALLPQRTPDASRWAKGLAAWELLHQASEQFIEDLNYWMGKDGLDTGYHVELKRYREVPLDALADRDRPELSEAAESHRWQDDDSGDYSAFVEEFRKYANEVLAEKPSPMYRPQVLARLSKYLEESLSEAGADVVKAAVTVSEGLDDPLTQFEIKTAVRLKETRSGLEVSPQDIGVGVSQLMPVLILALHQSKGIVSVEQPELHVHPAIQVELADLFVNALDGKNKIFLLETHSEHLILRLLRRIRETTDNELPESRHPLRPEQVSIVYVEPDEKSVRFSHIGIDEDGEFTDPWPRGFFGERLEEL